MKKAILLGLLLSLTLSVFAWPNGRRWLQEHYTFVRTYIPMRDGTRLYTQICIPTDTASLHPIIIERTPYGCLRDSAALIGVYTPLAMQNYIVVLQDVRGKGMSEGEFENMRPLAFSPTQTDEGTDTWDTVEWLLNNIKSNGNVGLIGTSYPGFYAAMGALCGHKAIKAVVPQAPCFDWFAGDDFHHNGAFMMVDAIDFIKFFNSPRRGPVSGYGSAPPYAQTDACEEYKELEPLSRVTEYFGDSIEYWSIFEQHPHYDEYWQAHSLEASCRDSVTCAVMVMGGNYDGEDCYGTYRLYESLKKIMRPEKLFLTVGPWYHGSWYSNRHAFLGKFYLGEQVYPHYEKEVLMPFLNHYLMDTPDNAPSGANLFFTGENVWRNLPCTTTHNLPLYLQPSGGLSPQKPPRRGGSTEYLSDISNPVPFTKGKNPTRDAGYIIEDQRFVLDRADVITFMGEPAKDTLRIAGSIQVDLRVAITGTDADFIIKILDIYPDDFAYSKAMRDTMVAHGDGAMVGYEDELRGYAFPIRMDVLRGRYRNSLSKPQPFTPNKTETICFELTPTSHTILPGHRVAVQIQSTWFPLIDLNPHQYTDNLYICNSLNYTPCSIKVLHNQKAASRIVLPILTD